MNTRWKVRRRVIAAVIAVVIAAVVWVRPWLHSAMTVKVTVQTDEAGSRLVLRESALFSEDAKRLPVLRAEVDLRRWAGKLVRFDVEGRVGQRWLRDSATGYVACEAELVTPKGASPVEFISWQQGRDLGAHTTPLGPVAMRAPNDSGRFAFAMKGSLWHCMKVPASARLRLRLKPVLAAVLRGRPKPYLPSLARNPYGVQLPPRQPDHPPDVFIYVIDALRPDHLGCYGYSRGTSPAIDAFAAEATLYENAYTPNPWTRPSVATMLSGLYASVHGMMHWANGLAEWPVLLPEVLNRAGYETRCFVTNPNLSVPFGYDQGYDQFIFCSATSGWLNDVVVRTLAERNRGKPLLTYLHGVDPHHPYLPKPESFKRFDRGFRDTWNGTVEWFDKLNVLRPTLSRTDIECLLDLYDAKIYEADQSFAGFLAALKSAGVYEHSLIVVTADHGEAFGEHDTMIHAWDLSQETMRVPLLIRFPGGEHAGLRVKERASLLDLTPTILAQIGLRPALPYRLPGMDLAREALTPDSGPARRIYGETARWDTNDVDLVTVIDEDGYKRVIDVSVPPRETAAKKSLGLWDTRSDPKEEADLSEKMPVRAAYDEQLIAAWLLEQRYWRGESLPPRPRTVDFNEAVGRQLRALGYLGGAPPNSGGKE